MAEDKNNPKFRTIELTVSNKLIHKIKSHLAIKHMTDSMGGIVDAFTMNVIKSLESDDKKASFELNEPKHQRKKNGKN